MQKGRENEESEKMLLLAVRFGDYAAFGHVRSDWSSDGILVEKLPVAEEEG